MRHEDTITNASTNVNSDTDHNDPNITSPSLINYNKQSSCIKSLHLTKWQLIRLSFVILLLIGIALNTFLGFVMPSDRVDCFEDKLFKLTETINVYFSTHHKCKAALLIISSLGIDLMVFISFFHWALYSTSWRLVLALLFFYVFRGINQAIFAMKFPEGYLWDDPKFPSLFVSYMVTRDFFFSGHVGFPIILGLEWNRLKKYYMQIICFVICAFEFMTMLVLRGHYSIDLLSGVVFSHYFFIIIEPLANVIDNWRFMNMKEKGVLMQSKPLNDNVNNNNNNSNINNGHNDMMPQHDIEM